MATYDKKTKTWRGSVMIGRHHIRKRGFLTKQIAEMWENQTRLKYQQSIVGLPFHEDYEISKILNEYLAYLQEYRKKKYAIRERSALEHWREFFSKRSMRLVCELPDDCYLVYLEWRKKQSTHLGNTPSRRTLNVEMDSIKKAFDLAKKRKRIMKHPMMEPPLYPIKKPGIPRYLTIEEIHIIEETPVERKNQLRNFYQAFHVLVRTGMRSDELCSLEISNLDLERNQIILRPDQTKAHYERIIPISEKLSKFLIDMKNSAEKEGRIYIFSTSTGKRQTPDNLNRRLRNILRTLEKKGLLNNTDAISIHTLRRTFISHLIMAGVDPAKVMAIVGHREWSTIRRYLALSQKYLSSDGESLPY